MPTGARLLAELMATGRLAPRLSEHSAEILQEAGLSPEEIAALVRDGVTRAASNT